MSYLDLNYQHVSFKGSHNSYEQPASMSGSVSNIATDDITGTNWANVGSAPFCETPN